MKPSIIIIFIIIFISTNVLGGTIDPLNNDKKYIEYGSKFNYVIKLCGIYTDDNLFCASAVLIDDYNFLTAAHVVKNAKLVFVTLDDGEQIKAQKITIHEKFDDNFLGNNDIAIGNCIIPFNLTFYPTLYDKNDEIGKMCCISGFGLKGTFNTGAVSSDNKRRAGSNFIDSIDNGLLQCSPTPKGSPNHTSLEFLISSGDSGGGLFIDGRLAGINSCVIASDKEPNSSFTDESGHTRISKLIHWIKKNKYEKK